MGEGWVGKASKSVVWGTIPGSQSSLEMQA